MFKQRWFVDFEYAIGVTLGYDTIDRFIILNIPFITIMYCLDKKSKGIYLFGKQF